MKEYKTYNQQLIILRKRGLNVPKDGSPKRFLEQENYYNVINGYKDLFLEKDKEGKVILYKDEDGNLVERYISNSHFNELKSLFLFDRELRLLFLKYILIFENSIKTIISHEFSKKYPKQNSYLDIKNYRKDEPKKVLNQISILTKTIHEKVDKENSIKHYIQKHRSVPLWVLVNYLTIGNISNLYYILLDTDKNIISKCYSDKYRKQYKRENIRISSEDIQSALKIFNLVRNKCAHDERLYNSNFKNIKISNITNYYKISNLDNTKIIVAILYLKILLDRKYFKKFQNDLYKIFNIYKGLFNSVKFEDIINIMGIDFKELNKIKV